MKQIILTGCYDKILPFYLAAEEWVAKNLPPDDYFFAWQVSPSIICGRHQVMPLEVDMDFCRQNDIKVWRRKSGGGCVYADWHNIMFSYITPSTKVETTFAHYTSMISKMLKSLGFDARPTGRNDVEINGMKVAGNAFYALPGRSIVHGTMLYDADFETMSKVLTPSRAKLYSKGVKSVPSRVTTLRAQGIDISCEEFVTYALSFLCPGEKYVLTSEQLDEVEDIMQTYLTADYLRSDESVELTHRVRIDGVGEIAFSCNGDCLTQLSLHGDFFQLDDISSKLLPHLEGVKVERSSLESALSEVDVSQIIAGLTNEKLIEALLVNKF